MKRFYRVQRLEDNALAAVINLCKLMDVKISSAAATLIKAHPYYPSFAAITDALETSHVETLAVRLSASQLDTIPLPAIAHLNIDQGQFVVLQHIDANTVSYVHAEQGLIQKPLAQFETQWSGNVLLAAKTTEDNIARTSDSLLQRIKPWLPYSNYVCIALALLLMFQFTGFTFKETIYRTLYMLSLVAGAGISIILVALQHDNSSRIHTRFCNRTTQPGCHKVLNSRAARIAGVSLADIGVTYFTGTLIAMLLGNVAAASQTFTGYLWLISLMVLPFSIFSVVYQKFKVSAWCPLCLTVAALLIIQTALLTTMAPAVHMHSNALTLFLSGYMLAVGGWSAIRPLYTRALRADTFKQTALSLKQNPTVIAALLRTQRDIPATMPEYDIILGQTESPFTITLVINPDCAPCRTVYAQMEKLLSQFRTRLRVVIRFAGTSDKSAALSRYFIQLSLKDMRAAEAALSQWFSKQQHPQTFSNEMAHSAVAAYAYRIYTQHLQWATRAGITTTPTCLIQNKPLPQPIDLADLTVYLKDMLSSSSNLRAGKRSGLAPARFQSRKHTPDRNAPTTNEVTATEASATTTNQ